MSRGGERPDLAQQDIDGQPDEGDQRRAPPCGRDSHRQQHLGPPQRASAAGPDRVPRRASSAKRHGGWLVRVPDTKGDVEEAEDGEQGGGEGHAEEEAQ